MKKPSKSLGTAKTLKAAASRTRLSDIIVQQLKDLGSTAFNANGTVDCDQLVKDYIKHKPELSGDMPEIRYEKALHEQVKRKISEQRLKEREGKLWPIEAARPAWFKNVIACKTKLYRAANEIAAECTLRGLNQEQSKIVLEAVAKHHAGAVKELHAGDWGRVECPHCKQEVTA